MVKFWNIDNQSLQWNAKSIVVTGNTGCPIFHDRLIQQLIQHGLWDALYYWRIETNLKSILHLDVTYVEQTATDQLHRAAGQLLSGFAAGGGGGY